eukprot:gene13985-15443_t
MATVKCRPPHAPKSIEAFGERRIPTYEEVECEKRGFKLTTTLLGKGAYAKVKLAYVMKAKLESDNALMKKLEETNDNKVAMKIITRQNAPVEYLNKFMPREIESLYTVNGSKNVMKLYETFRTERRIYLIMEYANKGDLLEFINSGCGTSKTPGLGEERSKKFFKQLINGIDYCHRKNVVHRDLKCENILIHNDELIKISDFGFATRYPSGKRQTTFLETFCGSYAYAAPEVLQSQKYDGRKADIWSLGVVLFAMLNGKLPFNDKNISGLLDQTKGTLRFSSKVKLSQNCQDLVRRILNPNPQKRITIVDIQRHPWMQESIKDETVQASQSRGVPDGKSEKFVTSPNHNETSQAAGATTTTTTFVTKRVDISEISRPINPIQKRDRKPPKFESKPWIQMNQNQSTMRTLLLRQSPEKKEATKEATKEAVKPELEDETRKETNKEPTKHNNPASNRPTNRRQCSSKDASSRMLDYKQQPKYYQYQGVKLATGSRMGTRWDEVKSNMKASGYSKLYYPGLTKNKEKQPVFSLPPVPRQKRSPYSSNSNKRQPVRTESRPISKVSPTWRHAVPMSINGSDKQTATTTTNNATHEIITLRRNWVQNTRTTNNRKIISYYTLSGKEIEIFKSKLNVQGRSAKQIEERSRKSRIS